MAKAKVQLHRSGWKRQQLSTLQTENTTSREVMIKYKAEQKGEVRSRDGGGKNLAGWRIMNGSSSHMPKLVRRTAEDGEKT